MSLDTWMLFLLAYLLATLTPGPNVLLVVKNGLQLGWRPALLTIGANLFCQAIFICLVAMGVGALLQTLPPLFLALKLAGGGYLIYLGYKALRATDARSQEAQRVGARPGARAPCCGKPSWCRPATPRPSSSSARCCPSFSITRARCPSSSSPCT
ncbi:LysE family translocator [Aeromonas rivipollensis]